MKSLSRSLPTVLLRVLMPRIVLGGVAVSLGYVLAAVALHPRVELEAATPRPARAVVDARLDRLGVDDRVPLPVRYLRWMSGLRHGDLGLTMDGEPVTAQLGRRIGVSLRLVTAGAIAGTALGVLTGAAGAIDRGGVLDRLTAAGAFTFLAVPVAVLAVVLQAGALWVDDRTGVRVFAWTGEAAPVPSGGPLHRLGDHARHLVLPTVTIALGRAAVVGRYLRATMAELSGAPFVRAAMARGMTRRRALARHALPVAAIPVVPVSGYGCAGLLAGSAVTEKVFAWHGMGEWLVDSIHRQDVDAVAAYCCFAALLVLLAGLTSDLLTALMDPRIRVRGSAR